MDVELLRETKITTVVDLLWSFRKFFFFFFSPSGARISLPEKKNGKGDVKGKQREENCCKTKAELPSEGGLLHWRPRKSF